MVRAWVNQRLVASGSWLVSVVAGSRGAADAARGFAISASGHSFRRMLCSRAAPLLRVRLRRAGGSATTMSAVVATVGLCGAGVVLADTGRPEQPPQVDRVDTRLCIEPRTGVSFPRQHRPADQRNGPPRTLVECAARCVIDTSLCSVGVPAEGCCG